MVFNTYSPSNPRLTCNSQTCKRRHTRCDEKKPVCGNCERLGLECEQSEDATWRHIHADLSQDQPGQTGPSLLDVFKSHMNDLEQHPEEVPSYHVPTPADLVSPSSTVGSNTSGDSICLTAETAFLLQDYVRTVATWMDCFDHNSTYQLKIPQLVIKSPLLFHCVCAFTANHLALSNSSHNPAWKLVAVKHYGEVLHPPTKVDVFASNLSALV